MRDGVAGRKGRDYDRSQCVIVRAEGQTMEEQTCIDDSMPEVRDNEKVNRTRESN